MQAEEGAQLMRQLAEAMVAHRFDEATVLWERLVGMVPAMKDNPTVPVLIALRDNRPHDAMHIVNEFSEDQWPQLRAMCLHAMGDPLWESYAQTAEESDDPFVRDAMRHLMHKPAVPA